jgi:pseudouridine-5'-monophosphatase
MRLLEWAQVPLSISEWKTKEKAYTNLFTNSRLLPGVATLLSTLSTKISPPIKLALASSAGHHLFDLKTSHIPTISATFAEESCQVFGDDPEMAHCDKKPSPDIFLLALRRLSDAFVADGEPELKPEECLVFEDSIAGVEAGKRAGMRVVWVPHPALAEVCRGREMDVLMGRTEEDGRPPDFSETRPEIGTMADASWCDYIISEDGRAEMRKSLEDFPYGKYGMNVQL